MEPIGTVGTICRYPVKSMAGEEVAQAFVGFAGLMGDRAFAFVCTSGPKGFPWHTGREQEDLVLFRPHFREGGATTLPPDIEETFKMAPGVNAIFPAEDAFEIVVGTPDGRTLPLRSAELKAMIEQRAGYAVSSGSASAASTTAGRSRCSAMPRPERSGTSSPCLSIVAASGPTSMPTGWRTDRTGRTSWSAGPSR
jgi:MOSC N-terminal beta barrel domain